MKKSDIEVAGGQSQRHGTVAMVEIQELGQVGSYMVDIMDIITSGKEILFNILISLR